jgi:DNA-binding PadR family transcriptional regulator
MSPTSGSAAMCAGEGRRYEPPKALVGRNELGGVVATREPSEGIGLAARVILHLSRLKRLGPNDVARLDYTQQGMVAAFDVRQSSLVKVLKSLLAGDVVAVERRFVGEVANRRMKVYHLTTVGESAARDLGRVEAASQPSRAAGDWIATGRSAEEARSNPNRPVAERVASQTGTGSP